MESVELYRQLLGLGAPWTVERVELDVAKGHVAMWGMHLDNALPVRSVGRSWRSTTIWTSVYGGTWTACNF